MLKKQSPICLINTFQRPTGMPIAVVRCCTLVPKTLNNVAEMVITGIFPWCFTPELYATRPDYINSLCEFVRGRPPQPVDAFMRQSDAVIAHDCESQLEKIVSPVLITFGEHDMITSTRFANPMTSKIQDSELVVFAGCSHAGLYEKTEEFNQRTLDFLKRHSG